MSFLLVLLVSISLVACKNYADDDFKTTFVKATKERWVENDKNYEKIKKDHLSEKTYFYERSKILNNEINTLSAFKNKEFKDGKLKKLCNEYISLISEEKNSLT